MFDPEWDLKHIWKTIKDDADVLDAMGLSEATNLTIAKRIIKRSQYQDLANNEKRLCIYFRPSRKARIDILADYVLQVDCHIPQSEDELLAYKVLSKVWQAVKDKHINGKYLEFDGSLGELPTINGYFCAGSRFHFLGTI